MTFDEFHEGIAKLELHRPGLTYGEALVHDLYARFRGWSGWAWTKAVAHLLDTHKVRALPVQADMAEALAAVDSPREKERRASVPAVADEEPVSHATIVATRAFLAALGQAGADGVDALDELHLIAKDVATAALGSCPCGDGVLVFQRLRGPDGQPTGEAYAGPCPNGCGRADQVARKVSRHQALAVVDSTTGKYLRWDRVWR